MRRVAKRVGITPTAIYRHFADKEALVATVVEEGFSILETQLAKATKVAARTGELQPVFKAYVEFAIQHPRFYDAMFLQPRSDVRRFPEDLDQRASGSFNIILDQVTLRIESGEFADDDPLEVALTLWSQAHGMVALYRAGRFGDHPNRFRKAYQRSMARVLEGVLS